ncbi:slit homolog 1 protein-like isoform X1 [Heptranchias perlo]|uniref:slit homolog 1 protein-like isoform X1 n=1 Tax=Heptranchias perlo TaxID=212740 RepID=UPI0035596440
MSFESPFLTRQPFLEAPAKTVCASHFVITGNIFGEAQNTPLENESGMRLSRMLYLRTFCCIYLFGTCLNSPLCTPYTDLAGKVGTNCSHRSLVSVPHSLPLDTEILLLSFNTLTTISLSSFENLSHLHDLDLSNNQIQHFDPDHRLPIAKLDLSSNSLTSVPNFSNLRNLRRLVLDRNKIPALPEGAFDDLVALDELSIRENAIQAIPDGIFDPLENLRYLTLSANRIKKFPNNLLKNLEDLTTFDVSSNNLSTIPQDFFENNLLPYVYLYNNPWNCECDSVKYLHEWIDMNDGNIYRRLGEPDSASLVCLTPSAWKGTPIIHLPIEQICNDMTTTVSIPQTHTVTERLQVTTFNKHMLRTSPPPDICAPYTDLAGKVGTNCSHRSLVSVPHSLPLDTEILLLSFNTLTSISLSTFENLSHLHDLDLSNNQIQHFDPDHRLPIAKLDLSSNSLTSVPNFSNLRNLRRLVLDRNKIPALPKGAFDDLVALDELSIRENAIQAIPDGIFDPLENLRYLTLSANRIKKFPNNLLKNLEILTTFDVSNNDLSTIPQDFFENNLLPYVYLYNNPWNCECDSVKYLHEWIDMNDGNIYRRLGEPDSASLVCLTPSAWKGTPIIHLPIEQICNDMTTTVSIPQTHTVTERLQVTTFNKHMLRTSPPPDICAPYTDLAGKVGTNCSHRSLVSVPHSLPLDTEILLLSFNTLTSISLSTFENLSHLHDLDLSNNQIQHFDPDHRLPIAKLDLSSNSLTSVPNFSNLRNLRRLVLDRNKIPALPEGAFDDLVALDELSIRGNAIQAIPDGIFDPLENLRYLTLSLNRIKKFPNNSLDNLKNLTTFDVSNNDLSTIPQDFFENNLLPYVYLYNNPWNCECDSVKYLHEWIDVNDGNIYRRSGEPDSASLVCLTPSTWKGTPIIHLPIEQICNDMTTTVSIPQTHTVTERLQVTTFNKHMLRTSPPPDICAPYTDLAGKVGTNCSHRSLESVPHSLPLDTEILLLSFNTLTSISLSSFKNLSHLHDLDLSNNQIQHFDPDHRLPIAKLDLSSNSLTSVPNFSNLRNLRRLVLNSNKIPALPEGAFDDLVALDELSIRGNAIQAIPDGIFDPLENLRYLTLSANRIKKFPNNSLDNLKNLTTFDVSNNGLRTIPHGLFERNPVLYIYLYNNSWHCDCDIQYLTEWIITNEGKMCSVEGIADDAAVLCRSPPEWNGVSLIHLPISKMCTTTAPAYVTLSSTDRQEQSSQVVRENTQTDPGPTSAEDTVSLWERRTGLRALLSKIGSSCFLLFILHCLCLSSLLLEICALLFYALRFYWRCYVPLKRLLRRPFNIRLVRYSLLVPNLQQIYPALIPGLEQDGMEEPLDDALRSPLEGRGNPEDLMDTSGDSFGSFL